MDKRAHDEAMELDDRARAARASGRVRQAHDLFARAAALEERVADAVPVDQSRTRGILRVSAVSMWREAAELLRARTLAQRYLDDGLSPGFAREMHELRATIHDELAALERVPDVPTAEAEKLLRVLEQLEEQIASGTVRLIPMKAPKAA